MTDRGIDFSALDPRADTERFEDTLRSIGAAAAAELASRRARGGVLGQLAGWRRPLLAAAAIAALISVGILSQIERPASNEVGVAEALGVPETIAGWVRSGETPSTAELLLVLEEDG